MTYVDKKNPRGLHSWDSQTDLYWGWFTYNDAPKSYHPLGIEFGSGGCSEGSPRTRRNWLRISARGRTLFLTLPTWLSPLRPWVEWVDTSRLQTYNTSTGEPEPLRPGAGYHNFHERRYGFGLTSDGGPGSWSATHLSVQYGASTHDSRTDQQWGWFLPWTDHRVVRHSYYDRDGRLFYTTPSPEPRWDTQAYDINRAVVDSVPTVRLSFRDFDGEELQCTTRIEEMEWWRGRGWFAWLGYLRKPLIKRTLNLQFSGETGRRKGSWKGGTLGHAIEMLPGELHGPAFRRYCDKHNMTYIGPVEE